MINLEPHGHNKGFLDSKTIIATLIILLSFVGWFYYITKKYPPQTVTQEQVDQKVEKSLETIPAMAKQESTKLKPDTKVIHQGLRFDSDTLSFDIENRGMGIQNITLKKFKERTGAEVLLSHGLKTRFFNEMTEGGKDIYFHIKKVTDLQFVGEAKIGDTIIKRTMTIDPKRYLLDVETEFSQPPPGFEVYLASHIAGDQSSSIFNRNYDTEGVFVASGASETERKEVNTESSEIFETPITNVSIAAINRHYFAAAILDKSDIAPTFSVRFQQSTSEVIGSLDYKIPAGSRANFNNQIYIGPKEMKALSAVDKRLAGTIDYGYFGWIAKPILKLLKFFYSLIGNYGVAIILVTLLIRLLLLPLNVSSYKSMKKMQEIQPQLKLVKEKYKNDPQKVQMETMNIMKQNKVNPIGGCLPMLLQFPIFIALYNVLAQSIELYQAPFALWIHDLSLKDPYFVLPVLMGITMWVQQKITPTAMDPAQAKVMQFMPIFFAALMFTLPSGLTLYIFVSTLFGIIQQYMIMKDNKQTQAVQQTLS